jgi:cytochrome P450
LTLLRPISYGAGMNLPTANLLFVPSRDPTALGTRLAAAARRDPIVLDTGLGIPLLLRKAHVSAVARDITTFSTRMFQGGILDGGLAALQGEDHQRMRRVYNMFFLPRPVDRYEVEVVRPIAHEVVARLEGQGHGPEGVDLLDAFAMELPRRVISKLFGFPMAQIMENDERVRTMFRGIVRIGDPLAAAQTAYEETLGLITEVVERERSSRSDTLLGEILRTLEAEDMATLRACQQVVLSLMLGGYETTGWLLANVLYTLLAHPDTLERVRRDPSLLPGAIDESMRWCPSVIGGLRLVERDVEVEGLELKEGMVIHLAGIASHYDEAVYPSPQVFDIDRRPSANPMVFGSGPRFCVGAPLGRMEARVGLEVLLERFPRLRAVPGDEPVFTYGVRESVQHGPDRVRALLE